VLTESKLYLDNKYPEIYCMYLKVKQLFLILIFFLLAQTGLKADDFYIIYTSNVNGAIENCGCGSDPLGGLNRVKSVIDKFKNENKNVFVVDGGDYFNSYPYPNLNDVMYKALHLINYDCLIPGDQEFVEGSEFYSKYLADFKDKVILTNAGSDFQQQMEKKVGTNRVVIYGYLSPHIFEFIEKPKELNLSNFVNAKSNVSIANDFRIAIIHGYLSNAEQFILENTSIDLVLLAHDQRRGIWEKNNTMIIGNGKDAEYISIIKVTKGNQWDITIDQKKISEELPEDDNILKLINAYKAN